MRVHLIRPFSRAEKALNRRPTIYQAVSQQPVPANYFEPVCQGLLNPPARYAAVSGSGIYSAELQAQVKAANLDATRDELDVLGTDFVSPISRATVGRYVLNSPCRSGDAPTSKPRSI